MNTFVTIGYKADGKSEILASPDVPYAEQKALLKTVEGYSEVELWSHSLGKIRSRKIKDSKEAKVSKESKVPKTSNASKTSKE